MFFLFGVIMLIFGSCSSDDDKGADLVHPIVGTWKIVSIVEGTTYYPDECQAQSRFVYQNNGNLKETIYEYNATGVCESYNQEIKWELLSNNVIKIIHEEGVDESSWNMAFSNNNNKVEFTNASNPNYKLIYERL